MKYALIGLATIAGVIAIVMVIGALLPRQHRATRSARFHQPAETIWAALTNYQEFPSWRSDVKRVESIPSSTNLPAWREFNAHGESLPMQTVEAETPRRLVTKIADAHLPFGGTWTTDITPIEGGTLVRITEDGEVRNPVFRFMSRFVFGLTATMKAYLLDLGHKFGEKIQVEN